MKMFPISTDLAEPVREEYAARLARLTDKELIKELLSYLDYEEESDSGRVFHPVTISSCRVMAMEPLDMLLTQMRRL
jgi:hypothetical protein